MRRFLDTNVFLYAFLNQNVSKKKVAVKIIADAIKSKDGCVSLQVVNEFCNVMVKKSGKPLLEILEAIKLFQHLPMIDSSLVLTQRALKSRICTVSSFMIRLCLLLLSPPTAMKF